MALTRTCLTQMTDVGGGKTRKKTVYSDILKEGKSAFGQTAVDYGISLGKGAVQAGANALVPALGTILRAMDRAGSATRDYRRSAGDAYDPDKALLRGTLYGSGTVLGGALAGGVGSALADAPYSAALKNAISAGTYAVGETGGGELGRALTEDGYPPDWRHVGKSGLDAAAFAYLDGLLQSAVTPKRNAAYLRDDLKDVQELHDEFQRALADPNATPEERAELAKRTLDMAKWTQSRMDELGMTGTAARDAQRALDGLIDDLRPYARQGGAFSLDSSDYSSHNTLNLGKQSSFGERMVQQIAENPGIFGTYDSPASFKAALEGAGFEVKPLGRGALMDVPFESGGGFRINFSDGGLLQYHPEEYSHHGGAYYKISTGKGGTHRYDINGIENVP